ncbi:MAG: ribosomal protein S18-alanine N-acetyltransferase [Oscillospiraceae bacterium]|nr:ribosomal protein S18-alanine N-acetyltransferase [Oscillospiraceae bacterium]
MGGCTLKPCRGTVRRGTLEDIDALEEIERDCFSHPMSASQICSMLRNNSAVYHVFEDRGRILGTVWLQTVLDEGYIGNVAVRTEARRQGIASQLLRSLERPGLSFLTLEVRAGNVPALALYRRLGYTEVGLRRNYYRDPQEDAVLMTKWLEEEKRE